MPKDKAGGRRQAIAQERDRVHELIQFYGNLLTQRQLSLAQQFCVERMNFSQIARDRAISRQAVHEAIRSVQQQLELFEMKLGLVQQKVKAPIECALLDFAQKLQDLRQRTALGEFGQECIAGMTAALDSIIASIAISPAEPLPAPPDA